MKTLFKNAYILTREGRRLKTLKNAYFGIENDTIIYVSEKAPEESYDLTKDMRGKILMPGLYNCHTHAPMVLLRGVGSDLALQDWLFGSIVPIEDKLGEADIEAGSYLALMEMIAGGTVSFSDMYFQPHKTVEAVAKAGVRANINRPVQAFDPAESPENNIRIKEAMRLYEEYHGCADGRVRIDFSIHAEYTCNEKVTRYFSDLCKEKNGNMHIHLSETVKEHEECKAKYGKTPTQWFSDLGAFDSSAFAAHCVTLEDGDIDILKEKNVSIVHNPTSNMKLGSGFAPVHKLMDRGLNVALGTDGAASNNNLSMFEEMHLAGIIHNGYHRDATIVKADSVIDMATVNGARLQGRENCGSLEVGYKADFIALDTDKPHLTPCLDVPALIVYSAQASDVCLTVCDGKILYENGEFRSIDAEKVYYDIKRTVDKLYG